MLFTLKSADAQVNKTLNVTSGSGTLVICPSTTYLVTYTVPSGYLIDNTSYLWNFTPGCLVYGTNTVELCIGAGTSFTASVKSYNGGNGGSEFDFTATFTALNGTIAGGVTPDCVGATPSFTATCNTQGSVTNYTWSVPPFMSISSGQSTATLHANANSQGTGNVNCSLTTTDGCSISPHYTMATASGQPPSAPTGSLLYKQAGGACEFDATISDVYASSFEWSLNNFVTILETTTTPSTYGGVFDPSTNYDIYVKVKTPCGTSWSTASHWNKTTPAAPPHCTEVRHGLDRNDAQSEIINDFKVYPNPASSQLTVEYQQVQANPSSINLSMYDMLGHKIITWALPNADNIITENISNLPVGFYMYVLTSGNDITQRGKIIIQR